MPPRMHWFLVTVAPEPDVFSQVLVGSVDSVVFQHGLTVFQEKEAENGMALGGCARTN